MNNSPTSPAEQAAHLAVLIAFYAENEAGARPFQTIPCPYIKAPAEADRFTSAQRRALLLAGIATTKVGAGDMVQIERVVTTYKTNAAGSADTTFRDANTLFKLMYARENFRTKISAYSRHKLGGDSTAYPAGEAIMTPSLGRAIAVSWFKDMSESSPVVFDPSALDQFKRDLVVELDATDPNRMNFGLPPNLINMLIVSAAQIQFRE
jgi:phage tail sheath gpL-like